MRDEMDDRVYQAHRHAMAANIGAAMTSIAYVFERLTARLYASPWSRPEAKKPWCDGANTLL